MDFRTEVNIPELSPQLTYNDKIMFIGSCFTESVGRKFEQEKFQSCINPFGVIFNPISVRNSLKMLIDNKIPDENAIVCHKEIWSSFYHHGSFSSNSKAELLEKIAKSNRIGADFLKSSNILFITWGTAWVFEHNQTGEIVSNCHKIPSTAFTRYRLEIDEIVAQYRELLVELHSLNPALRIVLTVSPVRHLSDGAHGNQLSKSTLILAAERLCELFENVTYFPSYEIVLDELRDYRFFAEDMVHPADITIKYIWEKLTQNWISSEAKILMQQIEKIVLAATHRPFNPHSEQHRQFVSKILEDITSLKNHFPMLDFSYETEQLTMHLSNKNS